MVVYATIILLSLILYIYLLFGMRLYIEIVNRIVIIFFFCSYIILLSLRDVTIGIDLYEYLDYFNYFSTFTWNQLFEYEGKGDELGFMILNKCIGFIGGERLYIILISCLTVIPIVYLFCNEAEESIFCISFFTVTLFGFYFSGLRQCLGMALVVPAYYCVKNKKIILFIIFILMACLFHSSSIIFTLFYPLYYCRIKARHLIVIIPLFYLFYSNLLASLEYVSSLAIDYETIYSSYSLLNQNSTQKNLAILLSLLSLYSFVVLDEKKAGQEEFGLRNILLFISFFHFFSMYNPVIGRINYFFFPFVPIVITRVNNRARNSFSIAPKIASGFLSAFFFYHFLTGPESILNFKNYLFYFER